jgi:hypothetical protein
MTTVKRGLGFAFVYKIPNIAKQQTVAYLEQQPVVYLYDYHCTMFSV